MKYSTSIIIMVFLMTTLFSCKTNEDEGISNSHDCIFKQDDNDMDGLIDDAERMIMNACMENLLLTKSSIENNLIGEWELIGHGEGWTPNKSQPCGYIIISQDELTFEFKNEHIDVVSTHQWDIEEINSNEELFFKFNILPEIPDGLFISRFCKDYMYGDATPRDGNMYLYKKVD